MSEPLMMKEISEQPQAIRKTLRKEKELLEDLSQEIIEKGIERIYTVGSGSSYQAGLAAEYVFENFCRIQTDAVWGPEFEAYPKPFLGVKSMLIAISQSGETADTLKAVKFAKSKNTFVLGITNTPESTLTKTADFCVVTRAGEERAIVATKTYVSMLAALYQLSCLVAENKGEDMVREVKQLRLVPEQIMKILGNKEGIEQIARQLDTDFIYVLGRGPSYVTALKAALMFMEGIYLRASALNGAEFKHGLIELIEKNFPLLLINPHGKTHQEMEEVARKAKELGAEIISEVDEKDKTLEKISNHTIKVPSSSEWLSPLLYTVPNELLVYYTGIHKGINVDSTRHVSKVRKF